jgi:hypothetical protein
MVVQGGGGGGGVLSRLKPSERLTVAEELEREAQVRKSPSWPRSWANFSLLSLYPHRNAWSNLHLLGQPTTFLAAGDGVLPAAELADPADLGGSTIRFSQLLEFCG